MHRYWSPATQYSVRLIRWVCSKPIGQCRIQRHFSSANKDVEKVVSTVSILENLDLVSQIPLEDVRNFCFIAHVDHGKSSLSSRLLELCGNLGPEAQKDAWKAATGKAVETGTISAENREKIDALDTLSVEQQRGITVKASTATMLYKHPSAVGPTGTLLLNMYDTPGHVDFGKEVSRSLCFVQGAVLLLDAAQGIQAQTWSVHEKAKAMEEPPELIMALTKCDLELARPDNCALAICEWLELDDPDVILQTSARSRMGILPLIDTIVTKIPPPKPMPDHPSMLRAQVVDSWYDDRGVNCLVLVLSGKLKEADRISIKGSEHNLGSFSVQEVGLVTPKPIRTSELEVGLMGYVRFGLKDPRQALPGAVLMHANDVGKEGVFIPTLPSNLLKEECVLYATVHAQDATKFDDLLAAVDKLALNDTGLDVAPASGPGSAKNSAYLGPGLRVGFQGVLHQEVFLQRLSDEFGIDALVTPPKVRYKVTYMPSKRNKLKEPVTKIIEDLSEWPEPGSNFTVEEPMVRVRIMCRDVGPVQELLNRNRASNMTMEPLPDEGWLIEARLPWGELVTDFNDQLKSVTAGYGSMTTEEDGYAKADLKKVDILLQDVICAPLSFVCHADDAQRMARSVCEKLKEVLPRMFNVIVVIQAVSGGRVIAAARLKRYRKNVLEKSGKVVGGGDQTRKKKLLEKQKKDYKKAQAGSKGRVRLSQDAFKAVITRSSS